MRRKGKDPCILCQFLGSRLLENPGEEKKKKECQWHCWYKRERAKSWGESRKSLMDLEPCRPFCDCPGRGLTSEWPECSACRGEDMCVSKSHGSTGEPMERCSWCLWEYVPPECVSPETGLWKKTLFQSPMCSVAPWTREPGNADKSSVSDNQPVPVVKPTHQKN